MPSCSIISLYVGTRSSQPTGVIMDRSRCSSACSGTQDCTKIVHRWGSRPAPSQSAIISRVSRGTSRTSVVVVSACQLATKKKQS
jgi:hypothetical protein